MDSTAADQGGGFTAADTTSRPRPSTRAPGWGYRGAAPVYGHGVAPVYRGAPAYGHRVAPGYGHHYAPVYGHVGVVRPVAPIWLPGYWGWNSGVRVWIGGSWGYPPYAGWVWLPAHWVWNGYQWVWQSGQWAPPDYSY